MGHQQQDKTEKRAWTAPRLTPHGAFREVTRGAAGGHQADQHFGGAMPSH